jgi:hypothetical protein
MDLEETEARNECAGEGQQQFNWPTNRKYLDDIFGKRITWRLSIEVTEAKVLRIFIGVCAVFKIERLSADIKATFNKALIRRVMTYDCPVMEYAADTHLLKL